MTQPRFFLTKENNCIQCSLCPRRCHLAPGESGHCQVRVNLDGKPEIPFYSFVTSLAVDPIEKKPLFHYRPGTEILSVGFVGCNLVCPFCQNWHISQSTDVPGRPYTPAELITSAIDAGHKAANAIATLPSIAYTYSEPLVHIEFLLDCMKEARKAGTANIIVSNGCVNSEAAAEILELTDAANIDLKCFSKEIYREILGGDLSAVLAFIKMAIEKGVHLELTTLIVPGFNDSKAEIDMCRDFIAELQTGGITVPWHLSAYHPDYKWRAPATNPSSLIAAAKRAKEKLPFVYTGNIPLGEEEKNFSDTSCPYCGKTLVSRKGYKINTSGITLKEENGKLSYFCAACGKSAPIRW